MNAVSHAYKPIYTHVKPELCVKTCTLNLSQHTCLECQAVLDIAPNTEEADPILAHQELNVWVYCYSLKVIDTKYYKIQV